MFNLLKFVRFFVYAIFILSQAVITSVAVWNMNIVQSSVGSSAFAVASQVDIYLIVLGSAGLLLIFPILFAEILEKSVFLCKVWFELIWVSVYGFLLLIGASLVTSLSTAQLCMPNQFVKSSLVASVVQIVPCSSALVLQVFTWTCAIFLTTYATLLAILSCVRRKEDPSVWSCFLRDFPWQKALHTIKRNSMSFVLPNAKEPVIYAPKPRHVIPPLLSCRSECNSAYEPTSGTMSRSAPARQSATRQPLQPDMAATSFYHSSVQKAMTTDRGSLPPPPPPARVRGETTSSPPPLGDWPRLDATSRPRTKRSGRHAPAAAPVPAPRSALPKPPQPSLQSQPTSGRRPLPLSPDVSAPLPRISPSRTRPPGSGRSAASTQEAHNSSSHRPPPLDLSKISTHRSQSRSQHRSHASR